MNIRNIVFVSTLAMCCTLAAGNVSAQGPGGDRDWHKGPPSVEQKLANISKALELSDEQSIEMLGILQDQERKRAALHQKTMELMGPEICAQRLEAEEAILSILTAEQSALFLQLKEDRGERTARKGRGREPDGLDCDA